MTTSTISAEAPERLSIVQTLVRRKARHRRSFSGKFETEMVDLVRAQQDGQRGVPRLGPCGVGRSRMAPRQRRDRQRRAAIPASSERAEERNPRGKPKSANGRQRPGRRLETPHVTSNFATSADAGERIRVAMTRRGSGFESLMCPPEKLPVAGETWPHSKVIIGAGHLDGPSDSVAVDPSRIRVSVWPSRSTTSSSGTTAADRRLAAEMTVWVSEQGYR